MSSVSRSFSFVPSPARQKVATASNASAGAAAAGAAGGGVGATNNSPVRGGGNSDHSSAHSSPKNMAPTYRGGHPVGPRRIQHARSGSGASGVSVDTFSGGGGGDQSSQTGSGANSPALAPTSAQSYKDVSHIGGASGGGGSSLSSSHKVSSPLLRLAQGQPPLLLSSQPPLQLGGVLGVAAAAAGAPSPQRHLLAAPPAGPAIAVTSPGGTTTTAAADKHHQRASTASSASAGGSGKQQQQQQQAKYPTPLAARLAFDDESDESSPAAGPAPAPATILSALSSAARTGTGNTGTVLPQPLRGTSDGGAADPPQQHHSPPSPSTAGAALPPSTAADHSLQLPKPAAVPVPALPLASLSAAAKDDAASNNSPAVTPVTSAAVSYTDQLKQALHSSSKLILDAKADIRRFVGVGGPVHTRAAHLRTSLVALEQTERDTRAALDRAATQERVTKDQLDMSSGWLTYLMRVMLLPPTTVQSIAAQGAMYVTADDDTELCGMTPPPAGLLTDGSGEQQHVSLHQSLLHGSASTSSLSSAAKHASSRAQHQQPHHHHQPFSPAASPGHELEDDELREWKRNRRTRLIARRQQLLNAGMPLDLGPVTSAAGSSSSSSSSASSAAAAHQQHHGGGVCAAKLYAIVHDLERAHTRTVCDKQWAAAKARADKRAAAAAAAAAALLSTSPPQGYVQPAPGVSGPTIGGTGGGGGGGGLRRSSGMYGSSIGMSASTAAAAASGTSVHSRDLNSMPGAKPGPKAAIPIIGGGSSGAGPSSSSSLSSRGGLGMKASASALNLASMGAGPEGGQPKVSKPSSSSMLFSPKFGGAVATAAVAAPPPSTQHTGASAARSLMGGGNTTPASAAHSPSTRSMTGVVVGGGRDHPMMMSYASRHDVPTSGPTSPPNRDAAPIVGSMPTTTLPPPPPPSGAGGAPGPVTAQSLHPHHLLLNALAALPVSALARVHKRYMDAVHVWTWLKVSDARARRDDALRTVEQLLTEREALQAQCSALDTISRILLERVDKRPPPPGQLPLPLPSHASSPTAPVAPPNSNSNGNSGGALSARGTRNNRTSSDVFGVDALLQMASPDKSSSSALPAGGAGPGGGGSSSTLNVVSPRGGGTTTTYHRSPTAPTSGTGPAAAEHLSSLTGSSSSSSSAGRKSTASPAAEATTATAARVAGLHLMEAERLAAEQLLSNLEVARDQRNRDWQLLEQHVNAKSSNSPMGAAATAPAASVGALTSPPVSAR